MNLYVKSLSKPYTHVLSRSLDNVLEEESQIYKENPTFTCRGNVGIAQVPWTAIESRNLPYFVWNLIAKSDSK